MGVNAPMKRSGFGQAIFAISATKKEEIGTLRITQNGNKYRYARAGGTALSAGKMGQPTAIAAHVTNEASPNAVAIGERSLEFTAGGAVTYAEDYFAGGALHVNDAAGEGHAYPIKSSAAVAAGTAMYVILEQGIKVALTTSSELTLVHSPWMAVIEAAVEENIACGIPPLAVTASYYYWAQTGGPAIGLHTGATIAIGTGLILSASVEGGLDPQLSALDIDEPVCAIAWGIVGVDAEYKPIFIKID